MKDSNNRYSGMSLTDEKIKRSIALIANSLINIIESADNDKTELIYTMLLINRGNTDKRIVLFPGELANTAEIAAITGITADAIATNGNVIMSGNDVIVECFATNLAYLQHFLKCNPTRVVEMQIIVATKAQLLKPITITKVSPYAKLDEKVIIPNQYRKASDGDILIVKFSIEDLQVDYQTILDVVVSPNSSILISFKFQMPTRQIEIDNNKQIYEIMSLRE
ncbi:MAG: hypothetical protein EOL95_07230 [Bacteroidia bacterium]|nr:hypothetical protein [Bacteroidia bacterium]